MLPLIYSIKPLDQWLLESPDKFIIREYKKQVVTIYFNE